MVPMLGPRKQASSSEASLPKVHLAPLSDSKPERVSDLGEFFNHLKKQKVTAGAKRVVTNNSVFLLDGAGPGLSLRKGPWWEDFS